MKDTAVNIMISSLSESTCKQYKSALKAWWNYCTQGVHNPYDTKVETILEFLADRFNAGASYSTLNTMRSAISLISLDDISNNSSINRFFKGVFRLRPTAPKYNKTWDVDLVLNKLEEEHPLISLGLKCLTEKLVMLVALGTSFRVQSIALISLDGITFNAKGAEIKIKELIKTSRPGACQPFAVLPYFSSRPGICIASTLRYYINYTKEIRGETKRLFLTYKKPYKAACSQTISRWIKNVLHDCGIDDSFTGHSTRHASTSKALKGGLSISAIKNAAGWSRESQVFAKYYNKPIDSLENNFAEIVFS